MKMKNILPLLCILGFIGWFLWSCDPLPTYSEIPEIHYQKFVFENRWDTLAKIFKETAVLTFSFIDGDGDLGVLPQEKPNDRISKIHYTWYKKLPDKTYESYQFNDGSINIQSDIPYKSSVMDKTEAQNKTLKGTIEIALETPGYTHGIDTMRVEFFIVDRAMNKSNVEYTPDFSILNPPTELKAK